MADRRMWRAGKLPESVRTCYDLLGTCIHERLQHAYEKQMLANDLLSSGGSALRANSERQRSV